MPVLDSLRSTFTIQGSTMHCNTSMMMHEFRKLSCVHIHKQLAFLSCAVSVCCNMYGHIHSKSMDQPGKVAHPARGQLNREIFFPCPRSCLRIWSRETASAVPSRVSLLISILRLNLVLTYGTPPEFRGGVHIFILNRYTSSGQSQVYRIKQLRTDGIHCQEYAGTGPVKSR